MWEIVFHDAFDVEFEQFPVAVQTALYKHLRLLQELRPRLSRPRVDTLNGSSFANMKELRFDAADGVWRVAFAIDPKRKAVLLVGGDKSGTSEKRFYQRLIAKADERYADHLKEMARVDKEKK